MEKRKKLRVKRDRCRQSPKRDAVSGGGARGINRRRPLFRGVRMRKWGRWVSEIRVPKSRTRIWLGSYSSPEKAARAYDAAVYCLHGDRARFNFPVDQGFRHIPEEKRRALAAHEVKAIAMRHAFSVPLDSTLISSVNVVRSPEESSASASTGAAVVGACNAKEFVATDGDSWCRDFQGPDGFLFIDAAAVEEVMEILDLP
ncbi:ethylene-responsive transcription factor ERF015-like [Elaeis guineensis]|uniref:ethylene-responsive transcription factor ERF015-like n=1 Tax=Elaeis guineensis var. tenera TaxID=51953 RepID=UPI003C6D80FB